MSKINFKKSREDEIRECFSYTNVEFHYPDNLPDFNLLKHFKKKLDNDNQETKENSDDNHCNIFGEKKI